MPRTTESLSCKHCGTKYIEANVSKFCCLFAPKPMGWCAWCGDEVENLTFCSHACSVSFQQDAFVTRTSRPQPAPVV